MPDPATSTLPDTPRRFYPEDFRSGLLVFLVALPLCLGIAEAAESPLISGLLSGIVGGLVVGILSGSRTSVSGPAAGMIVIVTSQIEALGGSFEAFLVAVVLSGVIQLIFGAIRAGTLTNYFPISILKGLLAAIGVLLILKMAPRLIGHVGTLSLSDFSSLPQIQAFVDGLKPTAAIIGLGSLVFLLVWDRIPRLKSSLVPAPLLVVIIGAVITLILQNTGIDENSRWSIPENHLVKVPVAEMSNLQLLLTFPDWSVLTNPNVYVAAMVIAVVSSLNTLINLKSIENIDPDGRVSPKNRELFAQGAGNIVTGLIGGLPVTSVIIRSSVNLNMGVKTRMSTVLHGILLVVCVLAIPGLLNAIPLSSLAAFLIVTGFKLASATLIRQMWSGGINQFLPFIITVAGIVFIDLLSGLLIGMGVGLGFVLKGAIQTPYKLQPEEGAGSNTFRLRLSHQVTFLNQAKLNKTLDELPSGSHVILDATATHHLDPCIETLLIGFMTTTVPEHDLKVSLRGFTDLISSGGQEHFPEHISQADPENGDAS